MTTGFLGLIATTGRLADDRVAALKALVQDDPTLTIAIEHPGLVIATRARAALALGEGVVIGTLFRRDETAPLTAFTPAEAARLANRGAAELVNRYWGSYVAILTDAPTGRADVVRAPFGELPCLYRSDGDTVTIASDLALLTPVTRPAAAIDWPAVVWHLTARDLRFGRTCLSQISELHGGDRLRVASAPTIAPVWSPWTSAAPAMQFSSRADAVDAVRAAVLAAIGARAGACGPAVLMLSGGLDSSIIAAALAHERAAFACLTLTTRDAAGDESAFAALTAQAVARPLHAIRREVARIDVTRSVARGLPRPAARAFAQESRRAALALAAHTGARAILTGGGGDNIFCSLQSGAPAADLLRTAGPGRRFVRIARELSMLASVGVPAVAWDALQRAWAGRSPPRRPCDPRFLTPQAAAIGAQAPLCPWLMPPDRMLPGKAGHVRLLAYARSYSESFDPTDEIPTIAPLLSQPLVETCLRVPSWDWYEHGRNRAVARAAFRDLLPPAIIDRRSKGSPESFVAETFERNRPIIAAMVLEGRLAAERLIDRAAIAAILADAGPVHGTAFMRIMELVDVEAWLACRG